MFLKIFSSFLLILFPLIDGKLLPFPKEIEKCRFSDNECIKNRFNTILNKYGKTGYPEIGLSTVEPYNLPDINYGGQATNSIGISINMTDVKMYDLSTSVIKNITGFKEELDDINLYFTFLTPQLTLKCKCNIFGKILAIPINAEGPMQIDLTNSTLALRMKIGYKIVDGEKVAVISKHKYLHNIEKFKVIIDISKAFKGDKTISDNINKILNDNWEELWKETSPITVGPFVDKMIESLNQILETFPYNALFLKDN